MKWVLVAAGGHSDFRAEVELRRRHCTARR